MYPWGGNKANTISGTILFKLKIISFWNYNLELNHLFMYSDNLKYIYYILLKYKSNNLMLIKNVWSYIFKFHVFYHFNRTVTDTLCRWLTWKKKLLIKRCRFLFCIIVCLPEWSMISVAFSILFICWKPTLTQFVYSRVGAWGLELFTQKEQRYRQKHKTALGERLSEHWICIFILPHAYIRPS